MTMVMVTLAVAAVASTMAAVVTATVGASDNNQLNKAAKETPSEIAGCAACAPMLSLLPTMCLWMMALT